MTDQGAELLALIYAHPAVDGHRLVYADWLQTNGDPRGEFIMLQFKRVAGAADAGDVARERDLLDMHERTWLGRLAPSLAPGSAVFRKGFLAAAEAVKHEPDALLAVADAPEWATVERLAGPPEVLRLPGLRSMCTVGPIAANTLVMLRRDGICLPAVTAAELTVGTWGSQWTGATRAVFPGLQHLELRHRDSYLASYNDFQPATFESLLGVDQPTLRSLVIRKHVLMSYRRWRDYTEPRPDLHAWALLARKCANGVHSIRLEPCRGWAFTLARADGASAWSLVIDWHTASASADMKTLELAIRWVRRSDFVHVRVRIHDFARPHYAQQIKRVMTGIRPLAIELVSAPGA